MLYEFHQLIWQRLPRSLRRTILLRTTQALAPRPMRTPAKSNKIIVAGYLRTRSGLGESARLCYEALKMSGADVAAIDLAKPMMQKQDQIDFQFEPGAQWFGDGTLILHINAPWIPFALALLGHRFVRGKRIVGYWHWELPQAPEEWGVGYRFVHEVWTPTRFTAQAIERNNPGKPVRIIPHPVAIHVPTSNASALQNDRPFVVLVIFNMGSSFERKNPLAAIKAFRDAFGDDPKTRLIVKVSNCQLYPPGFEALLAATRSVPNVELLTHSFSACEMHALYQDADVVMSLHRSEGFGLILAEAMLHGKPVIATDWSGTCDFVSESNGMPVRWRPVPASDPQGEYNRPDLTWADPDIADAAAKLRVLRSNPTYRAALGFRAREDCIHKFSCSRYYETITQILDCTSADWNVASGT